MEPENIDCDYFKVGPDLRDIGNIHAVNGAQASNNARKPNGVSAGVDSTGNGE